MSKNGQIFRGGLYYQKRNQDGNYPEEYSNNPSIMKEIELYKKHDEELAQAIKAGFKPDLKELTTREQSEPNCYVTAEIKTIEKYNSREKKVEVKEKKEGK